MNNSDLKNFIQAYREIRKAYVSVFANPSRGQNNRNAANLKYKKARKNLIARARELLKNRPGFLPKSNAVLINRLLKTWPNNSTMQRLVQHPNGSLSLAR